MSGTPGAEPVGDAYFGFYLMAMGHGRTRTVAELTAMLHQAGFASVRRHRTHTPLLVGVIGCSAGVAPRKSQAPSRSDRLRRRAPCRKAAQPPSVTCK